mmetsp:Transcript_26873/g.66227  ORF Transcript_26873/g.66227 Transcript_26873/m.66227 type:complete len:730 (+) Transcript_26873:109-2298(+)
MLVGGYEDSLRRLGVQSWQRTGDDAPSGAAPSYHFDMLQDVDRNRAYRLGIQATVEEGDLVVDIGTGSGLLALLAKGAGAEHCFAIEGDPALQKAAAVVIASNGLSDSVSLVPKHSTSVRVGFGYDIPYPAHVIVTEIFDSFLLGEGILPSMIDAKKRGLISAEGKVVPASATITAVLVESPFLSRSEMLDGTSLFGAVGACQKASGQEESREWTPPDPIQVHAGTLLSLGLASALSEPFETLRYDFNNPSVGIRKCFSVKATESGLVHGVVIWWDMRMSDTTDAVILSTAPPPYNKPLDGSSSALMAGEYPPPAREHWRQAACVFPKAVTVQAGEEVVVTCAVSEDGLAPRFAASVGGTECTSLLEPVSASQFCFPSIRRCHLTQMGCEARERAFSSACVGIVQRVASLGRASPSIVCVGDGPLLPMCLGRAAAEHGVRIICLQSSVQGTLFTENLILSAGLDSVVTVRPVLGQGISFEGTYAEALVQAAKEVLGGGAADGFVSEPCYYSMAVTGAGGAWALDEFFRFWHESHAMRESGLLSHECEYMPHSASLMATPIECHELWRRRRAPLHDVEGVDLSAFNRFRPFPSPTAHQDLTEWSQSPEVSDVLPWQDCMKALRPRTSIASFSPSRPFAGGNFAVQTSIKVQGTCHALVLSLSLQLTSGAECIRWTPEPSDGGTQALWLFPRPPCVLPDDPLAMVLLVNTTLEDHESGGASAQVRLKCAAG